VSYLLDTNILSELRKAEERRDKGLMAWFGSVSSEQLYLSVLVLGEIRKGIERIRSPDPGQARALDRWLVRVQTLYADRLLPVTAAIAARWGAAQATRNYPVVDALMAATADEHDLRLVTRNVQDLDGWPAIHAHLNPFAG
jgi:predicted nucleic acid-binding protein